MKHSYMILILLFTLNFILADDGYRLWLKYDKIADTQKIQIYQSAINGFMVLSKSPTGLIIKKELQNGLNGLLDTDIPEMTIMNDNAVIAGVVDDVQSMVNINLEDEIKTIGKEGYAILSYNVSQKNITIITANTETGLLYGTFHFLGLLLVI